MKDVFQRPALTPTVTSLRQHFSELEEDYSPAPISNPDSLSFIDKHRSIGRHAAVLIPVLNIKDELEVVFTRRADHLRDHAGQISFPGGRIEADDASPEAAALREAEEEIALPPDKVEIIGNIGPYYTVTGFCVEPVVGLIHEDIAFRPDPDEVADIIQVPLNFLLDPAVYDIEHVIFERKRRSFYSTYYEQTRIWGVTAGILIGLYEELALHGRA